MKNCPTCWLHDKWVEYKDLLLSFLIFLVVFIIFPGGIGYLAGYHDAYMDFKDPEFREKEIRIWEARDKLEEASK